MERWYQLDDPNAASNSNSNSSPRGGGDVGSLSGSSRSGIIMEEGDGNDDDDEPTLLHGYKFVTQNVNEGNSGAVGFVRDIRSLP